LPSDRAKIPGDFKEKRRR